MAYRLHTGLDTSWCGEDGASTSAALRNPPWESQVVVTDGTTSGFGVPAREYQPQIQERRKYA